MNLNGHASQSWHVRAHLNVVYPLYTSKRRNAGKLLVLDAWGKLDPPELVKATLTMTPRD